MNFVKWFGLICTLSFLPTVDADIVELQNGTATFSQVFGAGCPECGPNEAIDGDFGPDNSSAANGWSVARSGDSGNVALAETAAWETTSDLNADFLDFELHFNHFNPKHLLGRFRISVTADHRATFADGLSIGGDVDANWQILNNATISGPAGMNFTEMADSSILVGGTIPGQGTYHLSFSNNLNDITGIRLEALEWNSDDFPFGGPGFHPHNGNFILTEMVVNSRVAVPEPSSVSIVLSLFVLAVVRNRSQRD